MTRQRNRSRRHIRGLTLTELMIAMAIGLFMTGVVASLYLNMRSSFRTQEDIGRLQEAGRFAIDMIARDIRMAGYNSCGEASKLANVIDGGTNVMFDFSVPLIGYSSGYPASMVNVVAGTDAIIVKGVNAANELVIQSHDPGTATFQTASHSLQAGSILYVSDCSHAAIFQMTGPTSMASKTSIVHNKGGASPSNCEKELGGSCPGQPSYEFSIGSTVARVYSHGYYIAPASNGSGNSLWRLALSQDDTMGTVATTSQEMIEGIDSMLITYGLDTDGDRVADLFKPASTIAVDDWDNVRSVRVALLVRGTKSKQTVGNQSLIFDRNLSTTPTPTSYSDGFMRKVFSETIGVRNRLP